MMMMEMTMLMMIVMIMMAIWIQNFENLCYFSSQGFFQLLFIISGICEITQKQIWKNVNVINSQKHQKI